MRVILVLLLFVGTASAQYRFPPVYDDYSAGNRKALEAGKPLVTFVGVQPFDVHGAVVCMTLYLPEYPAQCVVVSKGGYWKATLPIGSKCDVICKEVDRLSTPAVTPFQRIATAPVLRGTNC